MMQPVLAMLADDQEHPVTQIRKRLAEHFSLSQDELEAMLPSGRAKMFANRVGWATTYLYQTKLLQRPRRSVYRITPRGHEILAQNPSRVDLKVLSQFEELHEFRAKTPDAGPRKGRVVEVESAGDRPEQTPEEQIDRAYRLLRSALAAELLDRVKEQSPAFFEQLVLDVLRAMGYGGTHEAALERLGQSGDGGVDGGRLTTGLRTMRPLVTGWGSRHGSLMVLSSPMELLSRQPGFPGSMLLPRSKLLDLRLKRSG